MVESGKLTIPQMVRSRKRSNSDRCTQPRGPLGLWCARQVPGARAGRLAPRSGDHQTNEYSRFSARMPLLDFQVELTLGEERLTAAEIRALCSRGPTDCKFLRGRWSRWIGTNQATLDRFRRIETAAVDG